MIRFVHCVKRRADLSPEEFRHHWNSPGFLDLLERLKALSGAVRLERSLTLIIPENIRLMEERGSGEPFDAMLEVWWQRGVGLFETFSTPEAGRLLEELAACQAGFIDFAESRRFFTES